ncbi:CPBP family intramembrane glutamic endopeptidase [Isoptericola sp. 178]|uniref:CPBP family intramembrane glutamic endopeptidase n=1 Tax=Isoptericola sp. 178 TaxID=3064651 RepID=UPI00271228E3|nr:type II CAAX endopeptidase family protein [Isoptericola sp. 178]MDO8145716.1 type II CAAX endopeptidase family protein [Isoptericola sp. 178]
MPNATQNPPLQLEGPTRPSGVPADVEYHRVYAGDARRIPRGLLAIVLLLAGLVGFAQLFLFGASLIDTHLMGGAGSTPLQHAAGTLSLAVLIPYSMLLQRWLYGLPARSLHSVVGRFRYGLVARTLLVFGPLLLVAVSVSSLLEPGEQIPWAIADLVAYFVIGMLLTPLAAAGEEYGLRGLVFRVVGGWTRGARSGAVLGVVVTTVLFALAHGSLDPYILTSYLVLFGSMAVITWRTGGLEVAVTLHALYNVVGLVLATTLHTDVSGALSGRAETAGSITYLIPSAALVVITTIIWRTTRGTGPARTPAR